MQKANISLQKLREPAYKKYNYSYFKPQNDRNRQINRYSTAKSHQENVVVNLPALIAIKDFQGQKNKWQSLREKMRGMKIDGASNARYRQNMSKLNKTINKTEQKQISIDFFYKLKNPQKQDKQDYERYNKNRSENYIKHLQAYCSAHFKCFDKQQTSSQIMVCKQKNSVNQNITNRVIMTGSSENNRYGERVAKVYKSNSIAPKYVDKISIKRPIGPIEDLIAHPQDLTNRLILQRKTLVQDRTFCALQLSVVYDRYVILVNIMGQKTKRLSLVLNKQQSRIVNRYFRKNLEILLQNLVVGQQSLTLKNSFLKKLEQKQEQFRQSRNASSRQKQSHPYLDSFRRICTPATNATSQQQKIQHKARTSFSQLKKRENRIKLSQQDLQKINIDVDTNTNELYQRVDSEIKSQIGESKIINNVSEQINKEIRQSILNNSEVIQQQAMSKNIKSSQLPKQSIKEENDQISGRKNLIANNSITEQFDDSIQQSRLTELQKIGYAEK